MTDYTIRKATIDDIDIIGHQRISMFHDMGFTDDDALGAADANFRVWVANKLGAGLYHGWFAVVDDKVVAGAGLWLNEWLPHPFDPITVRGYILNVYTERAYRQRGIARKLVEMILDFCRERHVRVIALHASDEGRHIYESLGFKPSNEMRIRLLD